MKKTVINVAKDFSRTPGARYRADGAYSGEEFREEMLRPHFEESGDFGLTIILDGAAGYATSFLEEAFGGLAREYGAEVCLMRLRFVSEEDPLLVEEITQYIREAQGQ